MDELIRSIDILEYAIRVARTDIDGASEMRKNAIFDCLDTRIKNVRSAAEQVEA